ncbi:MAG: hypothetical protein WD355_08740 [Balneolaceae bacterium]
MNTLNELIVDSCHAGLVLQNRDTGAMPAGHNGPYFDSETPVRNTSHWVLTFLKGHEISGEERLLAAAGRAIDYLCSPEARPMGHAFHHRLNPEKDSCNGLIGQAWSCEALIYAGEYLNRRDVIELAEEVFLMHPFDEESGLWRRLAVDGMYLPFDPTFNHQLWFGAIGAQMSNYSRVVKQRTDCFMEKLSRHLRTYRSGLIYHPLLFRSGWKERAKDLKRMLTERSSQRRRLAEKAVGYHLFNLYAFGLLKEVYPDHRFWREQSFVKALKFASKPGFHAALETNSYGFPYNPPGFEMAMAMDRFGFGDEEQQSRWVSRQIEQCWDPESGLMNRMGEDPVTQAARLYEAVRLQNVSLSPT